MLMNVLDMMVCGTPGAGTTALAEIVIGMSHVVMSGCAFIIAPSEKLLACLCSLLS
jgi:hypothetical protein